MLILRHILYPRHGMERGCNWQSHIGTQILPISADFITFSVQLSPKSFIPIPIYFLLNPISLYSTAERFCRFCRFVVRESSKTLIDAFITSCIDYCNSALALAATNLTELRGEYWMLPHFWSRTLQVRCWIRVQHDFAAQRRDIGYWHLLMTLLQNRVYYVWKWLAP